MRGPTVAGIDVGMTSALVVFDGEIVNCASTIKAPKDGSVEMRAKVIGEEILRLLDLMQVEYVAMEGAAYGMRFRQFDYGRIHGVLRLMLEEAGVVPMYIAPTSSKKWLTGSGQASKEFVKEHCLKWFTPSSYDEGDAFALAYYLHLVVEKDERDEDGNLVLSPL